MAKGTIRATIKSLYPDLSTKETEIADYILKEPKLVSRSTIKEIAAALHMADSTVFQFTKKLGFPNFREFRTELLTEEFDPEISIHEHITGKDSALDMARKVFASSILSLQATSSLLTQKTMQQAAEMIMHCRCLTFFGAGGSNMIAQDAFHKFLRSPIHCQHTIDSHMQRIQAALMKKGDCIIAISHTGQSKETLEPVRLAKKNNAAIIGITSFPLSPLAKLADVILISTSEETEFRQESLSSRITQLALLDSLFTIIMFRMEKEANISLRRVREAINQTKTGR